MPKDEPFVMPAVEVGRIVNWYQDAQPGTKPNAAIVTAATGRNVALAVMEPGYTMHRPQDGVMHLDDPRAREHHSGSGAWDFTEWDKWLMDVTGWNERKTEQKPPAEKPKEKKAA